MPLSEAFLRDVLILALLVGDVASLRGLDP